MGRRNAALAIALLVLGLTGVMLTGVATGSNRASNEIKVSVGDGGVTVAGKTFTAGKLTLVVVNKGTKKHALAIMGTSMQPKRTPTIAVGKTVKMTVILKAGKYHVWDPVTSSMSHAKYLTVKAPASAGGTGMTGGGTGTYGGNGSGSSGGMDPGMDPGMEGCDHG